MIFGALPEDLFGPLAGVDRMAYAEVLKAVHGLMIGEAGFSGYLPKEQVRAEIDEVLYELGVDELAEGSGAYDSADEVVAEGKAAHVYRRLRSAGWFQEVHEGFRTYVTIAPEVADVLSTLVRVADQRPVFYTGMVLGILSSLDSVTDDPENKGAAILQAAQDAAAFHAQMQRMVFALNGQFQRFAQKEDPRAWLSSFFDEFIEKFLIADYKTLNTENNPFQYKGRILQRVLDLRHDQSLFDRTATGVASHLRSRSREHIEADLDKALIQLHEVFDGVEEQFRHLERIRFRLEKRAASVVRFLDRATPGAAFRLRDQCVRLAAAADGLDDGAVLGIRLPLVGRPPVGERSLYKPRRLARPPTPEVIKEAVFDPAEEEYRHRLKEFLDRRSVTPDKIRDYLRENVGESPNRPAEELPRTTPEELSVFMVLPISQQRFPDGYEVVRDDSEMVDYGEVVAPRFSIRKKGRGDA